MGAADLNVPFDLQVWSADRCAAYLEQETRHEKDDNEPAVQSLAPAKKDQQ